MTTDTLYVPDISCQHCKDSIEGAVGGLEGVSSVVVAIEPKTVSVDYDDAVTSRRAIVEAVEAVGYDVTEGAG